MRVTNKVPKQCHRACELSERGRENKKGIGRVEGRQVITIGKILVPLGVSRSALSTLAALSWRHHSPSS